MQLTFKDLTKDISNVDIEDILSCWQWQLANMKGVVLISCIGDVFLLGNDDAVYWLRSGDCALEKVSEGLENFNQMLNDESCFGNWFLPGLVEQLIDAGKVLKEDQVYSFKTPPALGGGYSIDNIDAIDINVHFSFAGQICEQIRNLPDGTRINKVSIVGKF